MPTCPQAPSVPQEVLQRFRTMRDFDKRLRTFAADICSAIPEETDLSGIIARLDALEAAVAALEAAESTSTSVTSTTGCCAVTWISVSTTPYTIVDHNIGLLVDTSAAMVINLPFAADWIGEAIYIKDDTGTAGTNNITIAPAGVETVDDAAVLIIDADYSGVQLQSNGVGWEIV